MKVEAILIEVVGLMGWEAETSSSPFSHPPWQHFWGRGGHKALFENNCFRLLCSMLFPVYPGARPL